MDHELFNSNVNNKYKSDIDIMIAKFGIALISSTPQEVCRLAGTCGLSDIDFQTATRIIALMKFNFGLSSNNRYLEYAAYFNFN